MFFGRSELGRKQEARRLSLKGIGTTRTLFCPVWSPSLINSGWTSRKKDRMSAAAAVHWMLEAKTWNKFRISASFPGHNRKITRYWMKIGWRSPCSSRDIYLSINLEVNELAVVIWWETVEHFFRAYRASSNWHEGVSENSRQLNKLQTKMRVSIILPTPECLDEAI